MLESRELSISTICQIASILDDDNKQSILERVRGAIAARGGAHRV